MLSKIQIRQNVGDFIRFLIGNVNSRMCVVPDIVRLSFKYETTNGDTVDELT